MWYRQPSQLAVASARNLGVVIDSRLTMSDLHSNFRGGPERRTCFETECVMALQGHPRSLILAPIESAYATSYWSSIVTSVLSCPVSEIL